MRHIVQLRHPDYVREFFVMQHDKLRKTGLMKQAEPVLGRGLFLSEGELHRRQRKMIQPVFGRQYVSLYAPIIAETVSDASGHWQDGEHLDLFVQMSELSLRLTTRTLFGMDLQNQKVVQDAVKTIVNHFNSFLRPRLGIVSCLPSYKNRQCRLAINELDRTVSMILARDVDRNCRRESHSIVSILLNGCGESHRQDDTTSKLIRDEIRTLLVAGHETVATAITWTFYLIASHPEVEMKLQQEWSRVLDGKLPSFDDVELLTYTNMVLKESMRLYPPVWGISRVATEPFAVGQYVIPPKCILGVSPFVSHRDNRYFSEPGKFDPERWRPGTAERLPRFSYYPFGGGPRLCIGEPLAWLELTILLATIGQKWKLELTRSETARMRPLVTLRPLDPIQVSVHKRNISPEATLMKNHNCEQFQSTGSIEKSPC
jgi:cytochrome P450